MTTTSYADPEVVERTEMMELLLQLSVIDAVQNFNCDFGLLLMEEFGKGLSIAGIAGIDEDSVLPLFIPGGKSFSGAVADSEKPVIINDFGENAAEYDGMVENYYSGNVMSVPLFSGQQFMGLINLCRRDPALIFTEEDLVEAIEYVSKVSSSVQGQMIVDVRILELEKMRDELADMNERLRCDLIKKTEKEQGMMKQQAVLKKRIEVLQEENLEMSVTNKDLLKANIRALEEGGSFEEVMKHFDKGALIVHDGEIVHVNSRFEEVSGYSADEVRGKDLFSIFEDGDRDRMRDAIGNLDGEDVIVLDGTIRFDRAESPGHDMKVSAGLLSYEGREALFVVFTDTSGRKGAEDCYLQVSKLESVGQLAAGIAHEINTPTQFVGDNTRFVEEAFEEISVLLKKYEALARAVESCSETAALIEDIRETAENADLEFLMEEVPRAISQSLDGVARVAKIVRSMKEFSHPGSEDKAAVNINRIIENTVTVARNEWKYVADLEMDLEEMMPPVLCVSGEISQVILNMVINAAHAIGALVDAGKMRKGMIRIVTRSGSDFAEIEIGDNGSGMPEEVRQKMFDPFFTTKEVGKGTGQGLAISRAVIVDKHEGEIICDSEEGKGTTFLIRLPMNPGGTEVGG